MRYIFILVVLFFCSFQSKDHFASYCNNRFSFCIEYPTNFSKQRKPDNDDGLTFLSADKKTEIQSFGSLAIEGFDHLSDQLELAVSDLNVTY